MKNRTVADTARALAVEHHRNQTYGNLPYTHHLTAVAGMVALFTTDQETIAAAWLHDIVEDTDVESEDIRYAYGNEIARIVDLVTDPEGLSRSEAKAISLPRAASDPRASLVKLADRYCHHQHDLLTRDPIWAGKHIDEFDFFMMTFFQGGREQMPLYRMIADQRMPLQRLAELSPVLAM
ncbi:bifunctional (p)ppGpp synthetase/guanosine-3',5'-bis(diphosphate) 3'-pyrophosphohydrolase [Pseudaminobacter sp. 19-2017]|uniref:Bifunctional (P)ppGpp synthetase/guanosine-3',5'-bis(Diphosphate) 3'-pyrophosphohydrolase n=1 Tax=Pseudaminobacter soli (ex Zhang et al. 2022) TaxID=2831468 RepID=A0A942DWN3_9HYPH|nr:HD domain-containing protein [Pseudaminobacter soli]MBS3648764.1 bifunctional (p)ppGpp synthetase/guanosine-3',5'-bis(diphosphate) 3'-pyrophosphohydrolase [Pseudaminobacter soli]